MFETNEDDSFGLLEDDEFLNEILLDETETTPHHLESRKHVERKLQIEKGSEPEKKTSKLVDNFNLPSTSIPKSSCRNDYLNTSTGSSLNFQTSTPKDNWESSYGEKENKRKLAATHQPTPVRLKRERKFPGPAGLLPERKFGGITPAKLNSYLEEEKSPPNTSMEDLCSQGRCSGSVLEEEPWQCLMADLGSDRMILDEVNVASVKRKAAARCFVGRKVPFLAAVLHHLDVSSPDPCIILRDVTGEIHGTLHREVWEKFAGELVVGSVLVVKNVGLLSTGTSLRRHYLNITANNVATIYSASPDKTRSEWIYPFTSQDFIKTIQDWRSLITPSNGVKSPASAGLFSSSLNSPSLNNSSLSSPRVITPRSQVNLNSFDQRPRPTLLNSQNNQQKPFPPKKNGCNLFGSFSPNSPKPHGLHQNNCYLDSVPTTSKSLKNINISIPANSNAKELYFNPVINNKKPNISKTYSEKNCIQVAPQNRRIEIKTDSPKSVNATILLSQTSQLTAEEQSIVDSVFDGIDVDSLFDDDF